MDNRRRIEEKLDSNNIRQLWLRVQHINHWTSHGAAESDASIAEEPNHFFAQFKVELPEAAVICCSSREHHHPTLRVEEHKVRR